MRKLVIGLMVSGLLLGARVATATVDPACILQARDDFRSCKDECKQSFRDDRFRCRNVDPACGNACLAGRERCLDPYLQVLTDCLDDCKTGLQQGRQTCAGSCNCTLGSGCTSNCCDAKAEGSCYADCLDPYQVQAFQCRDQCREDFHSNAELQQNIKNCRASFRACVQACPQAQ